MQSDYGAPELRRLANEWEKLAETLYALSLDLEVGDNENLLAASEHLDAAEGALREASRYAREET